MTAIAFRVHRLKIKCAIGLMIGLMFMHFSRPFTSVRSTAFIVTFPHTSLRYCMYQHAHSQMPGAKAHYAAISGFSLCRIPLSNLGGLFPVETLAIYGSR